MFPASLALIYQSVRSAALQHARPKSPHAPRLTSVSPSRLSPQAVADLSRSVKDTEREIGSTEARSSALDNQRTDLAARMAQLDK